MNEFLTWKAAYQAPVTAYTWFGIIMGCFFTIVVFAFLFYELCNLVKWINKKFFTVYDWELDNIDYLEKIKMERNVENEHGRLG